VAEVALRVLCGLYDWVNMKDWYDALIK
jgi:hypothetical protein